MIRGLSKNRRGDNGAEPTETARVFRDIPFVNPQARIPTGHGPWHSSLSRRQAETPNQKSKNKLGWVVRTRTGGMARGGRMWGLVPRVCLMNHMGPILAGNDGLGHTPGVSRSMNIGKVDHAPLSPVGPTCWPSPLGPMPHLRLSNVFHVFPLRQSHLHHQITRT